MSKHLDRLVDFMHSSDAIDEFVAVERLGTRAELEQHGTGSQRSGRPRMRRSVDHQGTDIALYRDVRRGRGSTRVHVSAAMPAAGQIQVIKRATGRAAHCLAPAWSLPPPAAPARVDIADASLPRDLMEAARALQDQVDNALGADLVLHSVRVNAARERVTVRTSRGFTHAHDQTMLAVAMILAGRDAEPGNVHQVHVRGRRMADLDVTGALARTARHVRAHLRAVPVPPGRYDLVLSESALTPAVVNDISQGLHTWHERDRDAVQFGWFGPLVAQADARVVREGLAQYLPGQSIFSGRGPVLASARASRDTGLARPRGDALTVESNGAMPYGLLSRPVGELGEPVRRFTIVERGVAAGLALDLREAALRQVAANGGVRNLYVAPGSLAGDEVDAVDAGDGVNQPGGRPVLHAVALDWLDVDTRSGAFVAALGLGYRAAEPGSTARPGSAIPVTGGLVRGNVFELWAGARLASETIKAGWYVGPRAIRFSNVQIS